MEGISSVVKIGEEFPELLERKLDLNRILKQGRDGTSYVSKLMVKVGTLIPFQLAKKQSEVPTESKEDMERAAKCAGNSIIAYLMSVLLLEKYPMINVRVPKTEHDREKTVKHPSASLIVINYEPFVCYIMEKNLIEPRYNNLMGLCDKEIGMHKHTMLGNPKSNKQQIPSECHVNGAFHTLEDINHEQYMKANFAKRLDMSKHLGCLLNGELLRANESDGLSARSVREITEHFIGVYTK